MAATVDRLLQAIEARIICYSSDLQIDLGVSQATISRLLKIAGRRVYRLGKGRNSRYSLLDHLFTIQPLYRIDPAGIPEQIAEFAPLIRARYAIKARHLEAWLAGLDGTGLFDSLPYFLDDLRPQGFLGRLIARQLGAPYPADPQRWNASQVLTYLLDHGADLPGDLVLGDRALATATIPPQETPVATYPRIAEEILTGPVPGSSAGGEQPKFTAFCDGRRVLVKFSPRSDSPEAIRWRDILIAEHHAGQVLREAGPDTADSQLYDLNGRVFLQVVRFDREGALGRHPMISLTNIDAEFAGEGHDWVTTLRQLAQIKLVTDSDVRTAYQAQLFGQWIGNSDMHHGNLSFRPEANRFRLLPIYDMAPMRWAPIRGEVPYDTTLTPPVRDHRDEEAWYKTRTLARKYWHRLAAEERLSPAFRNISEQLYSAQPPLSG